MLRIYAHKYIELGKALADVREAFYRAAEHTADLADIGEHPARSGHSLSAAERDELRRAIKGLSDICADMDLTVSAELMRDADLHLPQSAREMEIFERAVFAELKSQLCLFVAQSRAKYYEWDDVVSEVVKDAFPTASSEIRAAATCFALDDFTGALFRAMRAAEIGARSLGEALQITFSHPIELAEWQPILDRVHTKVRELGNQPKSSERDADQAFYGQAAAQLQFFKDGWRVRVMHARATYNENQAKDVVDHVRTFFETLSTRLSEPL